METSTQVAAPSKFMFGTSEVRTVYRGEDEFFFVASDVSRILGYDDTNRMTRMLDEEDVIFDSITAKHLNQYGEFDREVEVSLITESGLYQCIFNSKREEAKAFTRWVTKEVLPQIRKHGAYVLGQEVETLRLQLANKDALIAQKDAEITKKDFAVEFFSGNCAALRAVIDAPDFKNRKPLFDFLDREMKASRISTHRQIGGVVAAVKVVRDEVDKITRLKSKDARYAVNDLIDVLRKLEITRVDLSQNDYI